MGEKRTIGLHMLKDRISEIPDEILSFTLSFLPMREAAITSILSRRWRYLWKTSLAFYSSFNLDVVTWRGSLYPNTMFFIHEPPGFREDSSLMSMERSKFVEWVNQTLQLVNSPVMESFSLQYYLKKDFALYIDQWITMAISKRVQNLEIDLSPFQNSWGVSHYLKELYTFPYRLFTQETGALVKCLRLNSCILGPLGLNYFSSLVDLRLEQVLINQENFVSFFSNCPNLENLCLVKCWRLRRLEISGGFLKLKYLSIVNCFSLVKIIIDARNLTRLEYWGAGVNFSFTSVPQLSNVIVSIQSKHCDAALTLSLQWLSRSAPKLESLVILASPIKQKIIPRQFAKLKKLVLVTTAFEGTLWDFIPLLHASPFLHKLELHWWPMSFEKCEAGLVPELSDSVHHYLKKIVLTGFNGSAHEIEFATYILNSTAALRKMTISNMAKRYNPRYGFFKSAEVASEKRKMEERASKQLMNVLPPGVELLFL